MAGPFQIDGVALSRLMPMHLALDEAGRILSAGDTLARLIGRDAVLGASFDDVFDLRVLPQKV